MILNASVNKKRCASPKIIFSSGYIRPPMVMVSFFLIPNNYFNYIILSSIQKIRGCDLLELLYLLEGNWSVPPLYSGTVPAGILGIPWNAYYFG